MVFSIQALLLELTTTIKVVVIKRNPLLKSAITVDNLEKAKFELGLICYVQPAIFSSEISHI